MPETSPIPSDEAIAIQLATALITSGLSVPQRGGGAPAVFAVELYRTILDHLADPRRPESVRF